MIRLITTESYFGLFEALLCELDGKTAGLNGKNLIFCEEKSSLMAERLICARFNGSFNTDVYSFGNYLRSKKTFDKILTKEGSAMAVKRVLEGITLTRFNRSKASLASAMYELISQLKSAKVTPDALERAAAGASGILADKLKDIAAVYAAYEKFLTERGFDDQSSALTYLPKLIVQSEEISRADVYLVGFTGFTAETADVIKTLMRRAKNVTAILPAGKNAFAFVNETADGIRRFCASLGLSLSEKRYKSKYPTEGEIIKDGLFNPVYPSKSFQTSNVCALAAKNPAREAERVAASIKRLVMDGKCRFRDVTVIVPDPSANRSSLKNAFRAAGVPMFLDERKVSPSNPLVSLAESFINVFKYGLTAVTFTSFFKNPLVCDDKIFTDGFENYLLKHNVDGARIKKSLPDDGDEKYADYEAFRVYALGALKEFSLKNAFEFLNVKDKIERATESLKELGEYEIAAVNAQIYDSVCEILSEMEMLLGGVKISYAEYGRLFASGIAALELSVIPQYNDAVFVGGFKEAALGQAKYLFATGLTSAVPQTTDDTALLSDDDLDRLAEIKLIVDPKIKVVNHREREFTALGMSAFKEKLFVSYPVSDFSGSKNVKSEILVFLEKNFTLSAFPENTRFLTEEQGLYVFASSCGRFIQGSLNDFTESASFYAATRRADAEKILSHSGKEVKIKLGENARALLKNVTSPTALEDFYKCPYRSFIIHGLNVKEKEDGRVDGLKNGNLAHDIFKCFTDNADEIGKTTSFDECFGSAVKTALDSGRYNGFFADEQSTAAFYALVSECKKYCKRFYEWLSASAFKTDSSHTEVKFGDGYGAKYPALRLLNGKVKLSGKIDRVDTYKDYCRIIDYKTGSADDSEKSLFSGTRLQLYLYAAAITDKKLAGAYYIPVTDAFKKTDEKKSSLALGKTLSDPESLIAQDKSIAETGESDFIPVSTEKGKLKNVYDERTMRAFVDYALKISENAARELDDGVIVASPFGDVCEYCEFRALCRAEEPEKRSVKSVDDSVIEQATSETDKTYKNEENGERICPN